MLTRVRVFLISLLCLIPIQLYLVGVWFPEFSNYSNGVRNLDARFSYTAEEVSHLLASLGENGRTHYVHGTVVDFFYAISMGFVVYSLFNLIMGNRINNFLHRLISVAIPVAYLLCDWMENVGILLFLHNYPSITGSTVSVFSSFSTIKHSMSIAALLYLLILILLRIWKRFSNKEQLLRAKKESS